MSLVHELAYFYATVMLSTDVAVRVITVLFLGAYNRMWSAKQY